MQRLAPPAHSTEKSSRGGGGGVRDGALMTAGAAAVAVCCLGGTLLLAVGGGVVASVVFGPWGLGVAVAALALWGSWRYRRRRACQVDATSAPEEADRD